ncbi:MAG: sugar phosphate nucleotidyltransferase [Bacteroidales bacterium]|nr:sugar phosphate nucleotidyltransferase [Lachnoclostridium sp.]MCM1383947.1 sugar phosphate nucleotidyltransferase [Lachnoclostridium sp.]MCM1464656.1 sugar phosphate nucleotidyltransferase [Bacteroidales bacterium]
MTIKDYIVSEETSLRDTMQIIDKNSSGIAFVCKDGKLLATVTDGDVRRSLMKGMDIHSPVREIANYTPVYLYRKAGYKAAALMKEKQITVLPIVDEKKRIVDIRFLLKDTVLLGQNLKTPVVIMAGGKGTRLKPYTDILPKPLIPVGDKTITEHIMEHFDRFGCSDFYMIVNYKKQFIKAYFLESDAHIHFVDEEEFLGTGGGIALVGEDIKETFFLTNCDILLEADYGAILKKHKEQHNIITIVCAEKKMVLPYGTVEIDGEGQVVQFREKPGFQFHTNTGFYVIEPEFLKRIPSDTFINITEIIESCIRDGEKVGTYLVDEDSWMDMGQIEELEKMRTRMGL